MSFIILCSFSFEKENEPKENFAANVPSRNMVAAGALPCAPIFRKSFIKFNDFTLKFKCSKISGERKVEIMNQKGFATLEVILMVTVLGILAAVAVPRFTDVTTKANTAKIQSDLVTLDSAIQIYYMENGEYPTAISNLSDYVNDTDNLKPPTGSAFINGTATKITATSYAIDTTNHRATLDSNTAGSFRK